MKLEINKNGTANIKNLTANEFDVILALIYTADSRCFREQEESGEWYSGDDFVMSMTDEQRKALSKLGAEVNEIYK